VLFIAASLALFGIQLIAGSALRTSGALLWYCATLLMMALLALGAVALYAGGRWLLQRRYPATADHVYRRALGVGTTTRLARRPAEGEPVVLAITFSFHNDLFATVMAALHGTQARPTQEPPGHV
jgi:hypothetical protein